MCGEVLRCPQRRRLNPAFAVVVYAVAAEIDINLCARSVGSKQTFVALEARRWCNGGVRVEDVAGLVAVAVVTELPRARGQTATVRRAARRLFAKRAATTAYLSNSAHHRVARRFARGSAPPTGSLSLLLFLSRESLHSDYPLRCPREPTSRF
jgi:sirohydrochlorin ferrochelatase